MCCFLSIFRNHDKIGADPSRVVKFIENFTYNYSAICTQPANRVERLYSSYAIKIQDAVENSKPKQLAGDIQRLYSLLEAELRKLRPTEEEFVQNFLDLEYGKSSDSRRLVGYTLAKLEALGQSGEFRINFDTVNIEHVLPQKPDKEWGVGRSEIKEYVNKLGNLTLVHKKINSKASNSSPQKKAEELAKSDVKMTQEIAALLQKKGSWTKDDILRRHTQLGQIAYNKIWVL